MTLYERMLLVRMVEDRLREMGANLQFRDNTEAVVVGVCSTLRPADRVVTSCRTVSQEVAMGSDMEAVVTEALGGDGSRIAATTLPLAKGIAWMMRNVWELSGAVVYFVSDLVESEPCRLPMLVVCDTAPNRSVGGRTHRVDGSEVADVREAALRALPRLSYDGCCVLEARPTGDPLLRIEERFTDGPKRRAEAEARIRPMLDDVFARVAADPIAEWEEDR